MRMMGDEWLVAVCWSVLEQDAELKWPFSLSRESLRAEHHTVPSLHNLFRVQIPLCLKTQRRLMEARGAADVHHHYPSFAWVGPLSASARDWSGGTRSSVWNDHSSLHFIHLIKKWSFSLSNWWLTWLYCVWPQSSNSFCSPLSVCT